MELTDAPSYHEVAAMLRARITSGDLPPGADVPSQADLAAEYGITPGKARMALNLLTTEGLVTAGQGRSRRVRDRRILYHYAAQSESIRRRAGAPADAWMTDVREQGFEPGYLRRQHTVEIVKADETIARALELKPGDLVVVRRRIRTVDGRPDNLNDTYYDHELALQFPEILSPDDVPQGIVALMNERGYTQVRYRHELRWRPPTPEEADRLDIPPHGVSVLVQMNTGYTEERPVKTTVTTWPGDSHVLIYEIDA
jgi:GntR family transcriptional regulator